MKQIPKKRYVLVYQCGIANVFEVESFNLSDYGRDAKLVNQGAFTSNISFCNGLVEAGHAVKTAHCDKAGDITWSKWIEGMGNMFSEHKYNIDRNNKGI